MDRAPDISSTVTTSIRLYTVSILDKPPHSQTKRHIPRHNFGRGNLCAQIIMKFEHTVMNSGNNGRP